MIFQHKNLKKVVKKKVLDKKVDIYFIQELQNVQNLFYSKLSNNGTINK